jgi:hypothetical protein
MDERIDYDNLLEKIIKNSINLGYCGFYDAFAEMISTRKNIIYKIEKKMKNRIEGISRSSDIILSIKNDKPFRILYSNTYITPWIKSTKKYKMTIPIVSLQFCNTYIETESNKVILKSILLNNKERNLLARNHFILNTYFDNFIIKYGNLYNITNYNTWNCKKSHLKKSEEYQKIYKSLSENTKLSPDIINLIIEQQYVIVDPGICTCSGT